MHACICVDVAIDLEVQEPVSHAASVNKFNTFYYRPHCGIYYFNFTDCDWPGVIEYHASTNFDILLLEILGIGLCMDDTYMLTIVLPV